VTTVRAGCDPGAGPIFRLDISPSIRLPWSMLADEEVEEIKAGVKLGLRGPIMLRWIEELLRDRDERIERDRRREEQKDAT
jgi:hypothetical protein